MGMVARQMRARYLALQAEAKAAASHLQKHPDFPSVHVGVLDRIESLNRASADQARAYITPERLKVVLEMLDIQAAGYLPPVADMESQNAYVKLVGAFGRVAIEEYTGQSSATVWFSGRTTAERLIADRVRHWTTEGYRRLVPLPPPEPTEAPITAPRRGYRTEVRAWMDAEEIATIEEAAKKLAVSLTTLKSIMSDKGEARYGEDHLSAS